MEGDMTIALRNEISEVSRLAGLVETFGETHALGSDVVFPMTLALDEVVTNVIRYGYPPEDVGPRTIEVRLSLADGALRATVRDDGRPFDPLTEVPPPDTQSALEDRAVGGLGVHFVRTLMDGCAYDRRDGWNELVFFKAV